MTDRYFESLTPAEKLKFVRALEHYHYDTVYHAVVHLVGQLCNEVGKFRRQVGRAA